MPKKKQQKELWKDEDEDEVKLSQKMSKMAVGDDEDDLQVKKKVQTVSFYMFVLSVSHFFA